MTNKKQKDNRRIARKFLIGITVTVVVFAILMASSGGYGPVYVLIALPFIAVGLFVLWGVYIAAKSLSGSISLKNSRKVPSSHALLARCILLLAVGAFLLGWFILQGGPHNASGGSVDIGANHILGGSNHPYMDMQVGIALLLLGTSLSLIHHFLTKQSGKTRRG
jgi:hypothetical protein